MQWRWPILLLVAKGKSLKDIRESYYLSDIYEVLEAIDLIADAEEKYFEKLRREAEQK